MQLENRLSQMARLSRSGVVVALLASVLATAACGNSDSCADGGCADDGGGDPGVDDDSSGGKGAGGKGSGGKNSGKGSGGLGGTLGSGGTSGLAGGDPGTGGKAEGSGGQEPDPEPDPGAIEGRLTNTLFDVLPGDSVNIKLLIERKRGFEGTVLVSLENTDGFTGSQVFAAPNEDEVSLTIQADFELEQGYYETAIFAESSDGSLSVEIPVTFRVRGAMGTFDQTFGLQEVPDDSEVYTWAYAVDDAGAIYVRTDDSLFRFDERGELDESFAPEGLATGAGPLLGMKDGVLLSTTGPSLDHRLVHILGNGTTSESWTGTSSTVSLLDHPFSLDRRGDQVAVAAEYASPQSWLQLFSLTGTLNNSFTENYYYGSSDTSAKTVRIDSQGRIIVANQDPGTIRRLLPDGSLDTSFGEGGVLELDDNYAYIVDVAVMSDDGLAIVGGVNSVNSLVTWTPAETGGLLESIDLRSYIPARVFRLPNDNILTFGYELRNPSYFSYLHTRSREPVPTFGTNGRLDLVPLIEDDPGTNGYPSISGIALDTKAQRLFFRTTLGGKAYLFAVWL